MDVRTFINNLDHLLFEEIRKSVVERHSREAAEIFNILNILNSDEHIQNKLSTQDPIKVAIDLSETTGFSIPICIRALERFVTLSEGSANGKPDL